MLTNSEIKRRLLSDNHVEGGANRYIEYLKKYKGVKNPPPYKKIKKKKEKNNCSLVNNIYYDGVRQSKKKQLYEEEEQKEPATQSLLKSDIQIRSPPPPPAPPPPAPPPDSYITPEWKGRTSEPVKYEKSGVNEGYMEELKKKMEERRNKALIGKGIDKLTSRGTVRDMFIKKYTGYENFDPMRRTLLNLYIKKYVEETETQKLLNILTAEKIQKNEEAVQDRTVLYTTLPEAPPAPPNQQPYTTLQLVPEAIPREQQNLLQQIQKGRKLKKSSNRQTVSKPQEEDYLKKSLSNIRKNIQIDEDQQEDNEPFGEGLKLKLQQHRFNNEKMRNLYGF